MQKLSNDDKAKLGSRETEGEGLTYAWYFKDASASSFSKTSTFKGTGYSVTMLDERNGRQVYCKITDKYGYSVKTNTVTLSADPKPIKIISRTGTEAANKGEAISFSIEAEGQGLTYQWYHQQGEYSYSANNIINGATAASYACTMSEDVHYAQFNCLITDQHGNSRTVMFPHVKGKDIITFEKVMFWGTTNKVTTDTNLSQVCPVGFDDHAITWKVENARYYTTGGFITVQSTNVLNAVITATVTNQFGYSTVIQDYIPYKAY